MIIELALSIIIIIIVLTEIVKYIYKPPFCERFSENDLFKNNVDKSYKLKYYS